MIIHLQDVERATEPTTPLFGNGLLEDPDERHPVGRKYASPLIQERWEVSAFLQGKRRDFLLPEPSAFFLVG
jgi:hypothetical protein